MRESPAGGAGSGKRIAISIGIFLVLAGAVLFFIFRGSGRPGAEREDVGTRPEIAATSAAGGAGSAKETGEAAEKKEEPKEEPAPEEKGPPLLRGRVTGEGAGIAGARVLLFSTSRIIESLEGLERLAPEAGEMPDIDAIVAAVKRELDGIRASAAMAKTGDDGAYEFRKLDRGGHLALTVADSWLFRYGDVVSIEPGREEVLDIDLQRGARIAGRVIDARGAGVKGALVTAEYRPGGMAGIGLLIRRLLSYLNGEFLRGPFQTMSADDGSFALASLPSGIYDVAAGIPGGVECRAKGVEAGNEDVVVYLGDGAWVLGTFVRQGGGPVPKVKCRLDRQDELVQLPQLLAGFSDVANWVNRLAGEGPRVKESGKRGEFRFGPLAAGKFKLTVEETGFLAFNRTFDLDWGQSLDLGVIPLDPGESIEGFVKSAAGEPLAGAKVLATPGRMGLFNAGMAVNDFLTARTMTVTDTAGRFRLSGLLHGKYRITATFPGFVPEVKRDAATGGDPVEIVLERGSRVTGIVVEARSDRPVAGAKVSVRAARTVTGEDGRFVLDGVVAGDPGRFAFDFNDQGTEKAEKRTDVHVSVRAPGYMQGDIRADIAEGEADVKVELEKVPTVRGTVLDPEGNPAPASLVRLTPDIPNIPGLDFLDPSLIFLAVGVSDLEGKFKFTEFKGAREEPRYKVIADHVLHARGVSDPFTLSSEGKDVEVTVRLQKGAKVSGTVTDGKAPVPGAAVRLRKAPPSEGANEQGARRFLSMLGLPKGGETTAANREGAFDFGKVLPGDYEVSAEKQGYIDSPEVRVTVAPGDERPVELVLDPGKEIAGVVVDPQDTPIEGARVRVLAETAEADGKRFLEAQKFFGGSTRTIQSGGDGSFRAVGLSPGTYIVIAEHAGFTAFERAGVEGGEAAVKAVLVPSATLRGTVVDAGSGQPIQQFRVSVVKSGPGEDAQRRADLARIFGREARDAGGRFVRDDLEGGAHTVTVTAQGFTSVKDEVVLTPGITVDRTFALAQAGRVRGLVVSAETGEPIPGVRISYLQEARREKEASGGKERGKDREKGAKAPAEPVDPKAEDARAIGETFSRQWLEEAASSRGDGSFLLEGVPEGPQTIVASHQDFVPAAAEGVEVGMGQEAEVSFRLEKGLSISGRVIDTTSEGRPGGRMVFVRGADEGNTRVRKSAISDDLGTFKVSGLSAGRYRVLVLQDGGKPQPEPVELDLVKDAENVEVRL